MENVFVSALLLMLSHHKMPLEITDAVFVLVRRAMRL